MVKEFTLSTKNEKEIQREKEVKKLKWHLFCKLLQKFEYIVDSRIKAKNLTRHSVDDVMSIVQQRFIRYFHNKEKNKPTLRLETDDDLRKITSLIYIKKDGEKTVVPEKAIRPWLRVVFFNTISNLKKKESSRQTISLEQSEYYLSDNSYTEKNRMELSELKDKIEQLKDPETIYIIKLNLEGYTYSEMIPFLVEKKWEEPDQDCKKLEYKLRQKKRRGILELRKLYGIKG